MATKTTENPAKPNTPHLVKTPTHSQRRTQTYVAYTITTYSTHTLTAEHHMCMPTLQSPPIRPPPTLPSTLHRTRTPTTPPMMRISDWGSDVCSSDLAAYLVREKQARTTKLREVYAEVKAKLAEHATAKCEDAPDNVEVENMLFDLEAKIVRGQILNGEPRIDGRDTRTVRPISVSLGVLPRAHGSALFTRGETQALVVATLGTKHDEQIIDSIRSEERRAGNESVSTCRSRWSPYH